MSLSNEDLEALRKKITDPTQKMDPWDRITFKHFLDNYGTEEEPTSFRERYDKYYAPFMAGFENTKKTDIIPPIYKQSSPFDSEDTIMKKMKYNKFQNRASNFDPYLTAGAHGLGLMAAMSGGLPGLVGGYAIKHGVPLTWSLVKNHFAKKAAKEKVRDRKYKNLMKKYPTL